jgi:hypothetical protein
MDRIHDWWELVQINTMLVWAYLHSISIPANWVVTGLLIVALTNLISLRHPVRTRVGTMARAKRRRERRVSCDIMHDALFNAYCSELIPKPVYNHVRLMMASAGLKDFAPSYKRIKPINKLHPDEIKSRMARLKQTLKDKWKGRSRPVTPATDPLGLI